MSLDDAIATPDGKRRYVRALFATIANRYDLITILLSYGRDRAWKRRLVDLAAPVPGARALDLATGTGDIAFAIRRADGKCRRARHHEADDRAGVAEGVSSWDAGVGRLSRRRHDRAAVCLRVVRSGHGWIRLRNVPDLVAAVDEMLRVLKPGGQALSLDFNRPSNPIVRAVYLAYLTVVGGALGWLLHRDPDTYRYIPASIRKYPGAEAVAALMESRGFERVRWYRVLGGLMAIHRGHKS